MFVQVTTSDLALIIRRVLRAFIIYIFKLPPDLMTHDDPGSHNQAQAPFLFECLEVVSSSLVLVALQATNNARVRALMHRQQKWLCSAITPPWYFARHFGAKLWPCFWLELR